MSKIKIVIVGIGGVGGYYGGLLAHKYHNNPKVEIYFVARGEHLREIREKGLEVITETGNFVAFPKLATDNVAEIGQVDFVLLCTKSYHLNAVIEQIKPCLKETTVILPLLNGVDITQRIKLILPKVSVWYGCVYIVARLNKPGTIESSGGVHDLFFGADVIDENSALKQLFDIFADAGIKAVHSDDILSIIWR